MLPIAVDAMGGDNAPDAIVEGAERAVVDELGVPVVLVGKPGEMGDTGDLPVIEASEVIAMDAEPGSSVRKMKDSSLVRAAEAVRDGNASAMVSAGNTGATMASALLRMGRIKGIQRPAIATPMPVPGSTPTTLLDAGANAECKPEWLVEFAQMGGVCLAHRPLWDRAPQGRPVVDRRRSREGSPFVKECFELLSDPAWAAATNREWIGNVEGRDVMTNEADVIVTDGFIGNVTLKTLEVQCPELTMSRLLMALDTDDDNGPPALRSVPHSTRWSANYTPIPSVEHCCSASRACA